MGVRDDVTRPAIRPDIHERFLQVVARADRRLLERQKAFLQPQDHDRDQSWNPKGAAAAKRRRRTAAEVRKGGIR